MRNLEDPIGPVVSHRNLQETRITRTQRQRTLQILDDLRASERSTKYSDKNNRHVRFPGLKDGLNPEFSHVHKKKSFGRRQGVVEAWFSRNHGRESRRKAYSRLFVPINVVRILICIHPTASVASLKSAACSFVLDRYQTQTPRTIRGERGE